MSRGTIDVAALRQRFPGLARRPECAFFDGPAGSQVPQSVIDAISDYLGSCNANSHGSFATSRESDARLERARATVATFLGTGDTDAVVFGANMTTLTFALSRALAATWKAGDEIVLTRVDHDANVTPWIMAARDAGATVKLVPFRADDISIDLEAMTAALTPKTRLVAAAAAANTTGTVNSIAAISAAAKRVGALVFVDAVHYAPHRLLDVAAWDCDFVACSAYKFFGPHVGILWGRRPLFAELPTYGLAPAGDELPGRWMTGTPSAEGIVGTAAAVEYIASLGEGGDLRARLASAYDRIRAHEDALTRRLLEALASNSDVTVWGVRSPERLGDRVATVAFTHASRPSSQVAAILGDQGIFAWSGNFYATGVTGDLGLDPEGVVRVGFLHYNTLDEVSRLIEAIAGL